MVSLLPKWICNQLTILRKIRRKQKKKNINLLFLLKKLEWSTQVSSRNRITLIWTRFRLSFYESKSYGSPGKNQGCPHEFQPGHQAKFLSRNSFLFSRNLIVEVPIRKLISFRSLNLLGLFRFITFRVPYQYLIFSTTSQKMLSMLFIEPSWLIPHS